MTERKKKTQTTVIEGQTVEAAALGTEAETHPLAVTDPTGFQGVFDTKRFRAKLEQRKENRDTLLNWVRANLVDGVDFGRIHVVKKDKCPEYATTRSCGNDYHWSKPSLWKPGAEKICGMLGWVSSFPNLSDYTRMIRAGRGISQIVLQCTIYSSDGAVMGEGIGARNLDQDYTDLNKALKMAKKSAHIDATLISAGLSEVFTQDYGDKGDEDDDDEPADPYSPGFRPEADSMPRRGRGGPALDVETVCTIGKFRGKPWAEVEAGFLGWLVDTITDKPDLVKRAQQEIANRQEAHAAETGSGPAYDPARPHAEGSSELASHARDIVTARSLNDLQRAWKATPERFQVPLKKSYEKELARHQAAAERDEQKRGVSDKPAPKPAEPKPTKIDEKPEGF